MNSNTILQSNLLNIIFENRNKDYGAYRLRKFYNNRLSIAIIIMISIVVFFSLFQFFWSSPDVPMEKPFVFETNDYHSVKFENKSKVVLFFAKKNEKKIQKKIAEETTPQIVDEKNINKSIASINHPAASDLIMQGNEQLGYGEEVGIGEKLEGESKLLLSGNQKTIKTPIFSVAELMPQYPGGLKALLAYLKKNIHAPADVEEGKEISVKVEFVVNYNGHLESFKVIETGGEVFDNEVLRVLKKMPLWIPGKSNGENVSVYYTVPVRFTNDFEN